MALRGILKKFSVDEHNRDLIELHFWVFLGSFIPSINIYISLSFVEIVFLRTLIAFCILGGIISFKGLPLKMPSKDFWLIILAGIFTAVFWMLFVLAAKTANASVALVGVATAPLWVSMISSFIKKAKPSFVEMATGLNAIFGVYMIFSSSFAYDTGMIAAILAALFSAIVTVFNGKFARKYDHRIITFYQMGGAWLGTVLFIPVYTTYILQAPLTFDPTLTDMILIFTLAIVFSIVAFSEMVKVLQNLTPFTVSLASNLQPIYGGIVALILFGQKEVMDIYFYGGTMIILYSLMAQPIVSKIFGNSKKKQVTVLKEEKNLEITE